MKDDFSSSIEAEITKRRQLILLLVLENRIPDAKRELSDLSKRIKHCDLTFDQKREARCRLLESEIDIAEYETAPKRSLLSVMKRILMSKDFTRERQTEVLLRGLSRLELLEQ
ncbi:hypothetical protein [Loktanella sp. Alg231-35]|uniref:hypothetical protein n=1 Tax=Loktanella sp. Alg231-35 TaxID=1922220 RepID=UPI000D55BBD6|nr:hypothetical protein [Loktanella sp. Alg231-35]